jgi:hypothetical protein
LNLKEIDVANGIKAYALDTADGFYLDDVEDPNIALRMLQSISSPAIETTLPVPWHERVQIFRSLTEDPSSFIEDASKHAMFKKFLLGRIAEKISQLSKFIADYTELANDSIDGMRIGNQAEAPVLAEALQSVILPRTNYAVPIKFQKTIEHLVYLYNTPEDFTKTALEQKRMQSIVRSRIEKRIAELTPANHQDNFRNSLIEHGLLDRQGNLLQNSNFQQLRRLLQNLQESFK